MIAECSERSTGHAELPLLLSVRQVAGLVGMSVRTTWRLVSTGELPGPVRVPGVRAAKWKRSAIEAWVHGLREDR